MQNLRDVYSTKPIILHFSGHGSKGTKFDKGDFLVIEKEDLRGENLTESKIAELFVDYRNQGKDDGIRLAVVLSCHSEQVGQIFRNAGIEHVVCINRECEVQDQACLTFTKTFYQFLLSGNDI